MINQAKNLSEFTGPVPLILPPGPAYFPGNTLQGSENTMPAGSQAPKRVLEILPHVYGMFETVPCIHGVFQPFLTIFMKYEKVNLD